MKRRAFLAIPLLLAACDSMQQGGAPSRITRSECLALAERYQSHRWMPDKANVRHGVDTAGISVDTPDVSYQRLGAVPGWWRPGGWNTGMPYQWGGFATPEDFDRGIAAGLAAGDVYTLEKRRMLEAAVSQEATGIDCSGFISRCWNLPRSYSTRELGSLCDALPSWDVLLPGDILNTYNSHVMLFAVWEDAARTRVVAFETGVPPYWLVVRRTSSRTELETKGFQPLRYRGIAE